MDIFFAYARKQVQDAEKVARDLSSHWASSANVSSLSLYMYSGFFTSAKHLENLENWIRTSNGMMIAVSPESVLSESIATLVLIAERFGKPRLPIITEHPRSGKEHRLFDYTSNAIDLTDSYSMALEQVLAVFETWQ